jgi:hypothetical protein
LFEAEYLLVALAAGVAAAAAVGVAVSASTGTVRFATFFDGFTQVDNAQARRTGAFHLGDGGHFRFSWWIRFHIYLNIYSDISQGNVKKL